MPHSGIDSYGTCQQDLPGGRLFCNFVRDGQKLLVDLLQRIDTLLQFSVVRRQLSL